MSPGLDDRIAARRARVRDDNRRKRLRRTVTVLVLLLALAGALALEQSWLVALDEIQITGTARLDPAEVLEVADLDIGTSTLRLRLGQAQERLAALPLVSRVEVTRVSPVTVRIDLVERVPHLVGRSGSNAVLISTDGVVIAQGRETALTTVETVGALPAVGTALDASTALGAAHLVWLGLSGPLRAEVRLLEARSPEDVDLRLEDGTRVRFGRADELDQKVRSLGALLEELAGERVAVIDVRAPNNPVVSGRDRS